MNLSAPGAGSLEQPRAADQGEVVEVDDVRANLTQEAADRAGLEQRAPRLVRGQGDRTPARLASGWIRTPGEVSRGVASGRRATPRSASRQWITWTSCPCRARARESRSTKAASPPKLWLPKKVVSMQNFMAASSERLEKPGPWSLTKGLVSSKGDRSVLDVALACLALDTNATNPLAVRGRRPEVFASTSGRGFARENFAPDRWLKWRMDSV